MLQRILLLACMSGICVPAFGQVNLTGTWAPPRPHYEDDPERAPGPALVEFHGLPINDQARQWGLAFRSSRLSLP